MNIDEWYEKDQKLTEEEVEKLIDANETLRAHINCILMKLRTVDPNAPYDCEDCRVDAFHYGIDLYWDETTGCCGHYETEQHEYHIPTKYLWEDIDEIVAAKKEQQRKEKEEQQRKDAEKKAAAAAERERKEFERYLKLKEKYDEE